MRRLCAGLAVLLLMPAAAAADGLAVADAPGAGCGGDAFSFAEVVPPAAAGSLVVVPDTLCADLANGATTRIDSLNIYVDRRAQGMDRQPFGDPLDRRRFPLERMDKSHKPGWRPRDPSPIWRQ